MVAEQIAHEARPQRRPKALGDANTFLQVAHERLARGHEQVGQREPRADGKPPGLGERPDAVFVFGPDRQVVLDGAALAVHLEMRVTRVALHRIQNFIQHADQAVAEALERLVPLAVPVCAGHPNDRVGTGLGLGRSLGSCLGAAGHNGEISSMQSVVMRGEKRFARLRVRDANIPFKSPAPGASRPELLKFFRLTPIHVDK